ncbi:T9SS type A sorting domain-containing protein [Flavobacterium sp. N1719]|uniref:T9SS type A sorting domain-containing protein n=1 Tax=Flavobacterium sp. N1719 TaxID=2885633 RepID=UPI0022213038|nr:T9SS type A sorting domain-containing protein [Flavobacterium sp. N1719]
MKKVLYLLGIGALLLKSSYGRAQVQEYLDDENKRIQMATSIEREVEQFVEANFTKYRLSKITSEQTIQELRTHEDFTDAEIEKALIAAKRNELRKLFFTKFPEKTAYFRAGSIPVSAQQTCVNGDFEVGTAGYTFWTDLHPQPQSGTAFFQSCATPTALTTTNVLTPTVNNFNSRATLIDSNAANYQQFDPVLAGFGVNVPTLNNNGGTRCIKLNNTGGMGSSDLSTVSRYFPVINEATLDFNFSLIMDNKPDHEQDIQPYFRARVKDVNGNVVDEFCIIANPNNCLFNRINVNNNRRILYTGWVCARLNVGELIGQPGILELSVSDCQPSAHFGTVYIDNVCGIICGAPTLGALNINPLQLNCPTSTPTDPIQVCGTYSPPMNATLSTLVLQVMQGNTVVGTVNAPTTQSGGNFCFTLPPNIFGTNPQGNFEFHIEATFSVNCPAGTFYYTIADESAAVGPDVTFQNCCLPTLTLVSPADDTSNNGPLANKQKERSDWIRASNVIFQGNNGVGNGVVYHAGNFVELLPGFEAMTGSHFAAYPEGCSGNYLYKTSPYETKPEEETTAVDLIPEEINLVRIGNGFTLVPNPAHNEVEIAVDEGEFNGFTITTIDGKIVMQQYVTASARHKVDVSAYVNGVYIITISLANGDVISEKLIKN